MTSTARTLDIGTVLVSESGCVVVVSPSMKQPLLERFNKYIFPADDVKVSSFSKPHYGIEEQAEQQTMKQFYTHAAALHACAAGLLM